MDKIINVDRNSIQTIGVILQTKFKIEPKPTNDIDPNIKLSSDISHDRLVRKQTPGSYASSDFCPDREHQKHPVQSM